MSAKHTPGPWNCGRGRPTRVYSDGCLVATIPEDDTPFEASWPERRERYEADARLIAAAPELLYALKSMLEIAPDLPPAECRCHISPPCSDCVNYAGEREIYAEAVAAIAKAEGRS